MKLCQGLAAQLLWLCLLLHQTPSQGISGFYTETESEQNEQVGPLLNEQREKLKKEVLGLLGLPEEPKPRHTLDGGSASLYMLELYNSVQRNDPAVADLNGTDVFMSFTNQDTAKNGIREGRNEHYFFNFKDVPTIESVIRAELRIYKFPSRPNLDSGTFRLELFQLLAEEEESQLVSSTTVDKQLEGWLSFMVTPSVGYWMAYPAHNDGFYLKITDTTNNQEVEPQAVRVVGRQGPPEKHPFLVVHIKSQQKIKVRRKRATSSDKPGNGVRGSESPSPVSGTEKAKDHLGDNMLSRTRPASCQRKTLYVSFKDLGWHEWIIAPNGYSAFFCEGRCYFPLGKRLNATNHAMVQTLAHLLEPEIIPPASCVPTGLDSVQVLYYDDGNNVVLKKFKDIAVQGCGCR